VRRWKRYPAHKSSDVNSSYDLPRPPSAAVACEADRVLRVERRQPTESGWNAFAAAAVTPVQQNIDFMDEIPSTLPEEAISRVYPCRIYPVSAETVGATAHTVGSLSAGVLKG